MSKEFTFPDKCCICGAPCELRVPWSTCEDCHRVIHRWEKLKAKRRELVDRIVAERKLAQLQSSNPREGG